MHRSYGLQGSLKRRYKHPFPASINEYYTAKNGLGTIAPRLLSRVKVGTHSALFKGSHTAAYTPKQGPSGRGRYHYPSERSARSQTSPGRVSERRTLPLCDLGREVLPKNAESLRSSDALMRVAVPRRRGPAGLRNLFLLLSELWLVHPALRTLCVYEVGVVSLPSACFACSRNAGRPLVKKVHLPFSEVGWMPLPVRYFF